MATQQCKELEKDEWSWSCWVEFWAICCCMDADENSELRAYYNGKEKHKEKHKKCEESNSGAPKFTNLRY